MLDYIKVIFFKFSGLGMKYMINFYVSSIVLNAVEFGSFSFYMVIANFVYLFLGFGIADTAVYMIVNSSEKESKKIVAATTLLSIANSFIAIFLFYIVLKYNNYDQLIVISFFSSGYFLHNYVKKVSVALNNKFAIIYFEFITYFSILVFIYLFGKQLTMVITIYTSIMFFVSIIFIIKLPMDFKGFRYKIFDVFKKIKVYGMKVHISQIIAMATYDLDKIFLKFIYGFSQLGIYNLGLNFIMPVKIFSQSMIDLTFKEMSQENRIPRKIIYINTLGTIVGSLVISIIGYFIIESFYSYQYSEMLEYFYLFPILALVSTTYIPINNFFSAKGLVKYKMINAIVLAVANILFDIVFIPKFGVPGAITATILALITNNIMFVVQYRNYLNVEKGNF